ncbi:30S ribosomal protein S24e [archaeon]|nr:30S ribosomal protein S24e [archaeon]|tara:strand:- start:1469 stop:1831 length:363 start_codon:yes stop_codon:yes gene_type:complete
MKTEKPLLGRTEITEELKLDKTPSNEDIKKSLAKSEKVDESLIVIKKIDQKYGKDKVEVSANIYKDKESLELFEKIKKKAKKKTEAKPGEAPKEEPAEKKEEPKKEEVKEEKDGKEGNKE